MVLLGLSVAVLDEDLPETLWVTDCLSLFFTLPAAFAAAICCWTVEDAVRPDLSLLAFASAAG